MAWDDLVRVKLEDGTVTSVGRAFAEVESNGCEILTDEHGEELPATSNGLTIPPEYPADQFKSDLKGAELKEALEAAGLPNKGSNADKNQALAEYRAAQASEGGGSTEPAV